MWLYEHELKQSIKPTIQVRYAGVNVLKLVFTGEATVTFHGAALVIRNSTITHLQPGDITATAELSVEGAKLLEREIRKWQVPGAVKLGDGIRITP